MCHCKDADSVIIVIIITRDVCILVNTMMHCDTTGYISLFWCQRHPYWIKRAGGRDVLELEGRREKMQLKERFGGGDVNVTPWFIVLSCHRQACIRSFSSFFFFLKEGVMTLLWQPHQPSPYKGWYKLINLIRGCDCGCDYRGREGRRKGMEGWGREGWFMEVGVRWQPRLRRWWAGRCGRAAKMLCMANEES